MRPAASARARAAAFAASLNFTFGFVAGRFFFQGSVAIARSVPRGRLQAVRGPNAMTQMPTTATTAPMRSHRSGVSCSTFHIHSTDTATYTPPYAA